MKVKNKNYHIKGETMANTIKIRDNVPKKKDIDANIKRTIEWLATEYKYYQKIHDEVVALENALRAGDERAALSELNNERRNSRYLGRCQRRVNRFDQRLTGQLDKLKRTLKDRNVLARINRFEENLKVENGHLVKIASMFLGELKNDIDGLRKAIKQHNSENVKRLLMHMEGLINELQKWLKAEVADLEELEKVA